MITRNIKYIIEENLKHFPIIFLVGPRKTGKKTLLQSLNLGYGYVSLGDTLELIMARRDPKTFLELHKTPLIIDEVQKAPELFLELLRIVNLSRLKKGNSLSNGLYILSGTEYKNLFKNAKESLVGRVLILEMNNLSLSEIYNRSNLPFMVNLNEISKRVNDFFISEEEAFEYIVKGFFPVLYDDLKMSPQLFILHI